MPRSKAANKRFWKLEVRNDSGLEQGDVLPGVAVQPTQGQLYLYGELCGNEWDAWSRDDTYPQQFAQDLAEIGPVDEIHVHINSLGGDLFAGSAIHSILKAHPAKVVAHIDGVAASAASLVAAAADYCEMPSNAVMMIHNPSMAARGDHRELQNKTDLAKKLQESMASAYAAKTGLSEDELCKMMDAETWMNAQEAKDLGFADAITEPIQVAACAVPGRFMVNGQEMDFSGMRAWPGSLLVSAKASHSPQSSSAKSDGDSPAATAVPIHTPKVADPNKVWDAAAAKERLEEWAGSVDDVMDWTKYRDGFAWYDAAKQEELGSYKLPHHDIEDGELVTVWHGVTAAAGAIEGNRDGVDITDADLQAVKDHIAKHYGQFDELPPWEQTKNSGDGSNGAPAGPGPGDAGQARGEVVVMSAESERKRIQEIDELAKGIPGAEALAAKAKYEEPISADAFARKLMSSDIVRNMSMRLSRADDAQASGANRVPSVAMDNQTGNPVEAERASAISMIAQSANERRQ